jgi:hypothetical protein
MRAVLGRAVNSFGTGLIIILILQKVKNFRVAPKAECPQENARFSIENTPAAD